MPIVQKERELCTVIVTVDSAPDVMPELESHARVGLSQFATFPGFVSGALHKSDDGRRLVQYLQWQTEADHRACMNDPQWDDLDSTRRFMELGKRRLPPFWQHGELCLRTPSPAAG